MPTPAVHRLDAETAPFRQETERGLIGELRCTSIEGYRTLLVRTYSFVAPLERSLLDTAGLDRHTDRRRFCKHALIEHDLQALGLRSLELQSLPQCMWIPWFDDAHTALGWAYIIERSTLSHAETFRQLASALPGEAAFAASYLKCYAGAVGESWQSFAESLDAAVSQPEHLTRMVAGALAGYHQLRQWRRTLDGAPAAGARRPTTDPPSERASHADGADADTSG
ncbi:MAG: biliverdin-producing heme oxygenase [Myxococcota bacterium]|nr:biliverdin-producing heme oxygenase [Myxococcota bacterium]